jgi:hypothetical protein
MLAVIFRVEGGRDESKKALFERFKSTEGVIATYQLESQDNPSDLVTFTIWKDEASRAKYMAGTLKQDIDRAWTDQTRTVYNVLDFKA